MTAAEYVNQHGAKVTAVQLTRATLPDVFEWAPGKAFWDPNPNGEGLRITGYTVFTPQGRHKAEFFDWIVRDQAGRFHVYTADEFADYSPTRTRQRAGRGRR